MMPGGYPLGSYEHYDRDSCACGCGNRAKPGLQPRFFSSDCRTTWINRLAIPNMPVETEPEIQDEHGETAGVVTFSDAVTAEQVTELRDALAASTDALVVETERVRRVIPRPWWKVMWLWG